MESIIKHRLKELEKRRDKYNNEYQQGGSPSALRTYEKYDDLCEICYEALRGCEEEDEARMRRIKNFNEFVSKFKDAAQYSPGRMYTVQEVAEILETAKGLI